MKIKINNKYMKVNKEELKFVREQIGEWETSLHVFENPLFIPVSEIAKYLGITRQSILQKADRRGIKVRKRGRASFFSIEDVLNNWFNKLK